MPVRTRRLTPEKRATLKAERMIRQPVDAPQTLRDLINAKLANPRSKYMTIAQIADACGLSRQFLTFVEKGQRRLGRDNFRVMAKVLGVSHPELQDAIDLGVMLGNK